MAHRDDGRPSGTWRSAEAAGEVSRPRPGTAVVVVAGELDLANCDDFGNWLARQDATTLVVDLTGVRFLAVCAARKLANVQKDVVAREGVFGVRVGDDQAIRLILDVAGPFLIVDAALDASV